MYQPTITMLSLTFAQLVQLVLGVIAVALVFAGLYYLYFRFVRGYVHLPPVTEHLCGDGTQAETHYLSYITADEHRLLIAKGGMGLRRPGTDGVPCYPKRKRTDEAPSYDPEPDATRRTDSAHALQITAAGRALEGAWFGDVGDFASFVPDLTTGDLVFVNFDEPSGTLIGRVHPDSNHQDNDWDTAVAVTFRLSLSEQWNHRVTKPLMSYRDFNKYYEQEIERSNTAFVRAGGSIVIDWDEPGTWTSRTAYDVPRAAIIKVTPQHFA